MLFEDTSRCDLFTPQKSEVEKFFLIFQGLFDAEHGICTKDFLGFFQ